MSQDKTIKYDYAVVPKGEFVIVCGYCPWDQAVEYFDRYKGKHDLYGPLEFLRRDTDERGNTSYHRQLNGKWVTEWEAIDSYDK